MDLRQLCQTLHNEIFPSPSNTRNRLTPKNRAQQIAIQNWLLHYQPPTQATPLEQLRGLLEAFHHLTQLEQWDAAAKIAHAQLPNSSTTPYPQSDPELHSQLFHWGHYSEQQQLYQALLHRQGPTQDALYLHNLGNIADRQSNPTTAIQYHHQALAQTLNNPSLQATILTGLGNAHLSLGHPQQALEQHSQALDLAQQIGDSTTAAIALGNLGDLHRILGNLEQAQQFLTDRLHLAQTQDDPIGTCNALGNLGNLALSQANPALALDYQQQALVIARSINFRPGICRDLGNLALAHKALAQQAPTRQDPDQTASEHWQTAITCLEEMRSLAMDLSDREAQTLAIEQLAEIHSRLGNYSQAQTYQQQALAIAQDSGDWVKEGALLLNLGSGAREQGDASLHWNQQLLALAQLADAGEEQQAFETLACFNLAIAQGELEQWQSGLSYCKRALALTEGPLAGLRSRCLALQQVLRESLNSEKTRPPSKPVKDDDLE